MKKMYRSTNLYHLVVVCLLFPSNLSAKSQENGISIQKQIDLFFGEYIVLPLAKVLFWPIPGIGMPLVVAWLLFGALFLTFRMRFVNIRLFKNGIRIDSGKIQKQR